MQNCTKSRVTLSQSCFYCRYDRDDHVEIVWENIQPGKEHNFNKFTENEVTKTIILNDISNLTTVYFKVHAQCSKQPFARFSGIGRLP